MHKKKDTGKEETLFHAWRFYVYANSLAAQQQIVHNSAVVEKKGCILVIESWKRDGHNNLTPHKKKRYKIFTKAANLGPYQMVITFETPRPLNTMNDHPVILFDGVCNFCNYWVNFAIKRNRKKTLRFATLQGETAKQLLPGYGIHPSAVTSVILVDKGKAYTQSSAAIRICKYLDGGWKLFYALLIIPKFLRDWLYNIVARNRYRWFGKRDSCMVPAPNLKERFLE